MCAARQQDGQFRLQDGHIIHPHGHARDQWDRRCEPEWDGYDLRVAWREAEPISTSISSRSYYARYHADADMVLVASWGFVHTAVNLSRYSEQEREQIREEIGGGYRD